MQEPFEWSEFLIRISANHLENVLLLKPLSWEDFIKQSGRDLETETKLRNLRQTNRRLFQERWGDESYMLSSTGQAVINVFPTLNTSNEELSYSIPSIFNDWKDFSSSSYISHGDRFSQIDRWWNEANTHLGEFLVQDNVSAIATMEEVVRALKPDHLDIIPVASLLVDGQSSTVQNSFPADEIRKHLSVFRGFIREGDLRQSMVIASNHLLEPCLSLLELSAYMHDEHKLLNEVIIFVIEYGLVHFYQGEYHQAINYCQRGRDRILTKGLVNMSLTAEMCIAIASVHLMDVMHGLSALNNLWTYYSSSPDISVTSYDSSVYKIDRSSLEYNLVSGMKAFEQYDRCAQAIEAIANLPFYSQSSSTERLAMVIYAFVNWSDSSQAAIEQTWSALTKEKIVSSNPLFDEALSIGLLDRIRILQRRIFHVLDSALNCLLHGADAATTSTLTSSLLTTITSQAESSAGLRPVSPAAREILQQQAGFVLITQYFESSNPSIQADINQVLTHNLQHPRMDALLLLNEKIYDFQNLPNPHHLHQIDIGRRLTFADAFHYANQNYPGRVVIIANADIYFDDSLAKLADNEHIYEYLNGRALALLKWKDHASMQSLQLRTDSQDAWILRTPIKEEVIRLSRELVLGSVRCDNRLAMILTQAGYEVINPAFAVHAIELESRERIGGLYSLKDAAIGETKHLLISDLMPFSLK
jgi:hypothetical protein